MGWAGLLIFNQIKVINARIMLYSKCWNQCWILKFLLNFELLFYFNFKPKKLWLNFGPPSSYYGAFPNCPNSLPSNAGLLTDANLGLLHGGWRRRKGKSYTSIRINDVPNICRPIYDLHLDIMRFRWQNLLDILSGIWLANNSASEQINSS